MRSTNHANPLVCALGFRIIIRVNLPFMILLRVTLCNPRHRLIAYNSHYTRCVLKELGTTPSGASSRNLWRSSALHELRYLSPEFGDLTPQDPSHLASAAAAARPPCRSRRCVSFFPEQGLVLDVAQEGVSLAAERQMKSVLIRSDRTLTLHVVQGTVSPGELLYRLLYRSGRFGGSSRA